MDEDHALPAEVGSQRIEAQEAEVHLDDAVADAPRGNERQSPKPSGQALDARQISDLLEVLGSNGARAMAEVDRERRRQAWEQAVASLLPVRGIAPETLDEALIQRLAQGTGLSREGLLAALETVLRGLVGEAAEPLWREAMECSDRAPAVVVLASNVPGLAAQALLPALASGRPVMLKSSSAEPCFAPVLVRRLTRFEPRLRPALAALSWKGGRRDLEQAALASSGPLVAYGGAEAMRDLQVLADDRLITYGPKLSLAVIAAGGADEVSLLAWSRGLARDVALLDQRGCLSVQAVYVLADAPATARSKAGALAEMLASALAERARTWPPGPPEPGMGTSTALGEVQQMRLEAQMLGRVVHAVESRVAPLQHYEAAAGQELADRATEGQALGGQALGGHRHSADAQDLATISPWPPGPAAGTVIVDEDIQLRPGPGLRTVRVHPVSSPDQLLSSLTPWRGQMQGAALAGDEAWALAPALQQLGLSRLTVPGKLQATDALWANGGISPLRLFA